MKEENVVLILMGPMGCGKTTIGQLLAKRLGWPLYDADDFHPRENVEKMRTGIALHDEDRRPWLERLRDEIQLWLQREKNAILACSALKQTYRDILGVDQDTVKTIYLKGSYEVIRERIEQRQHRYMNKDLLRSQFDTLEEPEDGLCVDISGTPETIVDTIIEALNLCGLPIRSS
jgi:gluconokinase